MKLLDDLLDDIYERPALKSSLILANAIASSCNYEAQLNLLDVSTMLNKKNKARLWRLLNIMKEPDYSTYEHCEAVFYLRKNKLIS
jgi:hypothetical protein